MGLGNKENIRQIKPDWRSQCRSRLGGIPSCVNTFLLRFENHSQSFPLLTLKLHYNGAIFHPTTPKTWLECCYITLFCCQEKNRRDEASRHDRHVVRGHCHGRTWLIVPSVPAECRRTDGRRNVWAAVGRRRASERGGCHVHLAASPTSVRGLSPAKSSSKKMCRIIQDVGL